MDRNTFAQYGGIVAVVLVIAILMAFATPFGELVKAGITDSLNTFQKTADNYVGGTELPDGESGSGETGGSGGNGGAGDESQTSTFTPGLYETGAIAKLNEGKEDEAASMLKTSWTDLVSSGVIVVENGVVSVGYLLPDNLPAQNEYGFYFGVKYAFGEGFVFYEDGSVDFYSGDELQDSYPADCAIYSDNTIDLSSMGYGVWTVYSDRKITNDEWGRTLSLGDQAKIEGELIMPNDSEITALSEAAFSYQASLTGIALPDGWSSISFGAFSNCSSLANVKLPNELTDIGDFAFQYCSSLESIMIPKSVTHIGEEAFGECTSLTDVTFEEGIQLETLGGINLFMFSGITSIEIPSSVKYIEDGVFKRCANLTSINFAGTMSQWNAITLGNNWLSYVPATYVQCSDGQVSLK